MSDPIALLLGAGGITALFMTFGSSLKAWFSRLATHIVVTNKVTSQASFGILGYLLKNAKRSPFAVTYYSSLAEWVKASKSYEAVYYKYFNQGSACFWWKKWPIWITGADDKHDMKSTFEPVVTFRFIRGTVDFDELVKLAAKHENNSLKKFNDVSRYSVIRYTDRKEPNTGSPNKVSIFEQRNWHNREIIGYSMEDLGQEAKSNAIDSLSLNEEQNAFVDEVLNWEKSKEWYESKGLTWKRGYALEGVGGTGKTSITRAIAQKLDYPLFIYDIATMDNYNFNTHWQSMLNQTPCIAVLEDLDAVFQGRKNILAEKDHYTDKMTFDCLLNSLDGIEQPNGLIVIITTNKIETLDAALLRPGRIDKIIHFGNFNEEGKIKMAKRIVGDYPDKINSLLMAGFTDTPAAFQERAIQMALNELFQNDEKFPKVEVGRVN